MKKFVKNFMVVGLFGLSVLAFAGCGSDTVVCEFASPTTPTFDLNGTWTFTITDISSSDPDCDEGTVSESTTITIAVSGNTVTVTSPDDPDFSLTGEVSGSEIMMSGSFTDADGTTTISCTTMVVENADLITFSADFSFSGSGTNCSGTASGMITRVSS